MRAARREVGSAESAAAGEAIVTHWAREPTLAGVRRVLLYAALPDELPTRPLFEHLRTQGVEALFPRCGVEYLQYARVDTWSRLSPNRLGQGQGWYDRTFADHDRGRLIGAGFALQVVATVPAGSGDRGVGTILTERGFTWVTRTA
jgi:5-formyltetrahydrofolate cyclo-ligase